MEASSILSTFSKYLIAGVALGTGLAVAISGYLLGAEYIGDRRAAAEPDLIIKQHRVAGTPTFLAVIGQVGNPGDRIWKNVQIAAEFRNAGNQVVEICSGYIDGRIRPGEFRNFKADCSVRSAPMPDFDKYSVAVTDARDE